MTFSKGAIASSAPITEDEDDNARSDQGVEKTGYTVLEWGILHGREMQRIEPRL